ncbi:MAG: LysM peptidoglycan-binding domain-containing protein [Oscillospiraceae bacterium]
MTLSPMRYKNYVWPHNPRVYEISFRREVVAHKVPFGMYALQSLGRENRVLRGEGEFCGPGAYAEFKRLATVFCEDSPGILTHPVWQSGRAYFVSLSLRQEPTENFVAYSFEFWECFDGSADGLTRIDRAPAAATRRGADAAVWHIVAAGDTLWDLAAKNGMTLKALIALNPQVKNPNLIRAGDKIRTA